MFNMVFNQYLSTWVVYKGVNFVSIITTNGINIIFINHMFRKAAAFNQDLSSWDILPNKSVNFASIVRNSKNIPFYQSTSVVHMLVIN